MKKLSLILFIPILIHFSSSAQDVGMGGKLLPVITINDKDYPVDCLPGVVVISKRTFTDPFDQERFNRLRHNILVVYPYAIQAAKVYNEMTEALQEKDSRHDRKKYIKEQQKQLEAEFEEPLKNLTTKQGDLLVKLISRYTGKSCYDLISEFKNPISAFFWNSASKLYGYQLKETYDPQEQRDIEMIVRSIEGTYAAAH